MHVNMIISESAVKNFKRNVNITYSFSQTAFFRFYLWWRKKGLVDLRRNFRPTRPTDFGGR